MHKLYKNHFYDSKFIQNIVRIVVFTAIDNMYKNNKHIINS